MERRTTRTVDAERAVAFLRKYDVIVDSNGIPFSVDNLLTRHFRCPMGVEYRFVGCSQRFVGCSQLGNLDIIVENVEDGKWSQWDAHDMYNATFI